MNKPGLVMKKVECYATNVAELSAGIRGVIIDPATDELKDIKLREAIDGIQVLYDQSRETLLECEGIETELNLPQNTAGFLIETLISALGFDLNSPVTPDSTVVAKPKA